MIKRIKPGKRFCEAVVVNGIVTTAGVTGSGADTATQTRDILAQIDAAIEDAEGYVEWHGSADSAEWHADGSHEVQIGGHYYATDRPSQHHLVERPMSRGGRPRS